MSWGTRRSCALLPAGGQPVGLSLLVQTGPRVYAFEAWFAGLDASGGSMAVEKITAGEFKGSFTWPSR